MLRPRQLFSLNRLVLAIFALAVLVLPQSVAAQQLPDDDSATVSLSSSSLALSQAEGGTFTFDVELSASSSEAVTVRWTATATGNGVATLSGPTSDLAIGQNTTGTVIFPPDSAANATQEFSIATNNDVRVENSETFTVTLSEDTEGGNPLPTGVEIGSTNEATATITDDDTATLSIESTAEAAEGSAVEFAVNLSAAAQNAVTVRWTATSATPGAGAATLSGTNSDLTTGHVLTGTVVFQANDTADKTVSLETVDDTRVEGNETFTVTLAEDEEGGNLLPGGVSIPESTAAGTGTITEDDTATLSIASTASAAEGSAVEFAVNLSAASQKAVTVRWTATSTAPGAGVATLSGTNSDLTTGHVLTGTVVFQANDTADKTVSLETVDDTRVEGSETFTVTLSQDIQGGNPLPDGVSIPTADMAGTGTITEDDTATLSIQVSSVIPPQEGMPIEFVVNLSAASSLPVTVRWTATSAAPDDGAARLSGPNSDLTADHALTGTVVFSANDNAAKTVSFATVIDQVLEFEETFTVMLAEDIRGGNPLPNGVSIPEATAAGTGTISQNHVILRITPRRPSALEGEPIILTAEISQIVNQDVISGFKTRDLTAVSAQAGVDYRAEDGSNNVTIPAGELSATFEIATIEDFLPEPDETFLAEFSGSLHTQHPAIRPEATFHVLTILDDDVPTVSITPEAAAAEGAPVEFTVNLSALSSSPVTVRWTATATGDGAATLSGEGSDLASRQILTGTVMFAANNIEAKTVSLATVDDDLVEGAETFTVTLSEDTRGGNPLPTGVSISPTARASTGTITEDDVATVSIDDAEAAEGSPVAFEVNLSAASSEAVTVRWTATSAGGDGAATLEGAGSDLGTGQILTGTVEFQANDTATKTVSLATVNDDLVEGAETFTVTLDEDTEGGNLLPDGVSISTTAGAATGTITEDDTATVSLSPLSPAAVEGRTFTFTATLSAASALPVTVRWTAASGTATLGSPNSDLGDGQATTGTVTFPADSAANATQEFTIATSDDAVVEGSETFTVSLSPDDDNPLPTGVTIGDDDEAEATITESDAATLSIDDGAAAEGSAVVFEVNLSAASSEAVTVRWTATTAGGNGATTLEGTGSDLTAGHVLTGTVEFQANDTATKTVSLATVDDDLVEGDETFTVTLSPDTQGGNLLPDGVSISTTAGAATGTITEDDAATVSLSPLSPSAVEGGTFMFTATLSAASALPVTVRWTAASGTAMVDGLNSDLGDGQATTGTVTFPADSAANATQEFTIATSDDAVVEGSETFTVSLSPDNDNPLPTGVTIGDDDEAEATITEDETATVSINDATAAEGSAVAFEVNLSAASQNAVTVRWTATTAGGDGAATLEGAGSDLGVGQVLTGTVEFQANDTATKTVSLATVDDDLVEGAEIFTVTLSQDTEGGNLLPDGVSVSTTAGAATGTITEDDTATVSLSPLSPSAAEGGTFTFTATLSAASALPVTVRWTATGSGENPATLRDPNSDLGDGQATTGTVTFPADSAANATQTFMIATDNDARVEGSETFTVTLSPDDNNPLQTGVTIGDDDEAEATITEADTATLSIRDGLAVEGSAVVFEVNLSAASEDAVTVRWTATTAGGDGAATLEGAESDLTAGHVLTGTVVFQADDTADKTVSLATVDDDLVEGAETFTVTLSQDDEGNNPLPTGVSISTTAGAAIGTITETGQRDEAAVVSIASTASALEGAAVEFAVNLSVASANIVTVRWTATSATGVGLATLQGVGSDLTASHALTGTVVFQANDTADKTVSLETLNDDRVEGSETFTVTLSQDTEGGNLLPGGVSISTTADEGIGTITEDDTATLSIASTASAPEGSEIAFAVNLSAAASSPVTVRWTATASTDDGTATLSGPNSDLISTQILTGTVVFAADDNTEKMVSLETANDDRVEGPETFTVTLSQDTQGGNPLPDGVSIPETTAAGIGTITEADAATLSISNAEAAEGSAVVFEVNLSAASQNAVTVRWTATTAAPGAGAATLEGVGSDLTTNHELTGTVVFVADDNATKTVSLATVNDDLVEGPETFTVTLSQDNEGGNLLPDGVSIPTADSAGTGTITEDETATVSIAAEAEAAEGSPVVFEVSLSAASQNAVTVRWTATAATGIGAATLSGANSDLTTSHVLTGTVVFAANDMADKTVNLATVNDDRVEGSETFTVTLSQDTEGGNLLPDGVSINTTADEGIGTITEDDTATLSISDAEAAEGSAVAFEVDLSAASAEAVTVRWTATSAAPDDGAATLSGADSDLTADHVLTGTVEFQANDTATKTVSLATVNDDQVEGNETFTVTLFEDTQGGNRLPDGVSISETTAAGTGTITEDETAVVSIDPTSLSVTEGQTFTFRAQMSNPVAGTAVTVRWTATSTGDETVTMTDLGADQETSGTVTFPADQNTPQTFTISTRQDNLVEGDETFTITLNEDTEGGNPLPTGVEIGSTNEATATITDDDTAMVSIASTASAAEGSAVEFAVNLSAASANAVTVRWTATTAIGDGAATLSGAGSDLTASHALTGTVVFQANDTADKMVSLETVDDDRVEGSETFTVTLSEDEEGGNLLPDGVSIPEATAAGTGTITEDDTATLSIMSTASAPEGSTIAFAINLSAAASEAVTVRWTATSAAPDDGAATLSGADSDLTAGHALTGTVVFSADDNTLKTVSLATANDDRVEGPETFTVTLSEDTQGNNPLPDGVSIPEATAAGIGTITEADAATLSISDAQAAEGSAVAFTVNLSAASQNAVTVRWTATSAAPGIGAATLSGPNSDLTANHALTGTVVFVANDNATKTVNLATVNDNRVEGSETFTVTLSQDTQGGNPLPDGVSIPTADAAGTGTITEADTATVSIGNAEAAEGSAVTFTVNLSAASQNAVTVRWTATTATGIGAATLSGPNSDLASTQVLTSTVVFAANDNTARTIRLATVNDDRVEGPETFTVTLAEDNQGNNPLPDGVSISTTAGAGTGTITEADSATLSISDAQAAEGSAITFEINLSEASSEAVTVRWTATTATGDGAATLEGAGSDLTADHVLTGTVVFAADDTAAKSVRLATVDDALVEGPETFTVTLAEDTQNNIPLPDGVSISTTAGAGTGTITEDDAAQVSLSPATLSATEGGSFTYTVSLSAAADEAVNITWTASIETGDNADLTADLQATTNTVTFAANDNTDQTFIIATTQDTENEPDETFTVTLTRTGTLPTGVEIDTARDSSVATIVDDELPSATVSIGDASVAEDVAGGSIGFTVSMTTAVNSDVILNVTYAAGATNPATPEEDLGSTRPTMMTIEDGDTRTTLTVPITNDEIIEGNETFTVTVAVNTAPTGVTIGDGVATGTITDDDDRATVSIEDADPVAEDAGPARFTVSLSRALDSDVLLDVTYAAGDTNPAIPEEDLGSTRPAMVMIPANHTEATLDVPIFDDTLIEDAETFTVTITGRDLPDGVTITDGVAIGTIALTAEPSVLTEPRRIGAGTALRRHATRFDSITGTIVRNRLEGRRTQRLSATENLGNGAVAISSKLDETGQIHWGAWLDTDWTGLDGTASGRQADVYGGVDYLGDGWLIGALIGYEMADLDISEATYRSDYTHFGLYGGARLSARLLFDGAATYGMATPEVALGNVSASYNAYRITARSALTGDLGLKYGLENGSVTVAPQLGVQYSRETLGSFTDSVGKVAEREVLELGRFNAGPRLTWNFDGGRVVGGLRMQWDFLQLDDGVDGRLSGAANIGLWLDLTPNVTLGIQGDVDGIGIADDFRSFGGSIGLNVRF